MSKLYRLACATTLLVVTARGAVAQCCGDCNSDGRVTIDEILKAVNGALNDCQGALPCGGIAGLECASNSECDFRDSTCSIVSLGGVCVPRVEPCPDQNEPVCGCDGVTYSNNCLRLMAGATLAHTGQCQGGQRFPASGQTTSYGTGSDGDVRAGAALSYTDNGDGTITDHNTGLMWEKKDDSGGIHDKDNTYTWGMDAPPYTMNGTMVTQFLAALNRAPCFANHCDWRIPNVKELQSIVDYEIEYEIAPAVNAAFHNAAGCTGCTDVRLASCSCTASSYYWSSTTYRDFPSSAWFVSFYGIDGIDVGGDGKSSSDVGVRAVRGGL